MGLINKYDQVGAGMYRELNGQPLDSMMAVGAAPWHFSYNEDMIELLESGAQITSKDVNRVAGLNWSVYQQPLEVTLPDGRRAVVEDYFLNIRDDNHRVVGVVQDKYRILGNDEAPIFLDNLVDDGDALFETAGSLYGGSQCFWLMRLPELVTIAGEDREGLETYLLLTNSHDGSTSIVVAVVVVRVVCQNTLAWALDSAIRTTKIRHTESAKDRLHEARRVLEIGFKYTEELAQIGDKMLHTAYTEQDFQNLLNGLVPTPEPKEGFVNKVVGRDNGKPVYDRVYGIINQRGITRAENTKGDITAIYNEHPTQKPIVGTMWGAVQAVQFYSDHETTSKNTRNASADENRFKRITDGRTLGADAFKIAHKQLVAV